MDELDQVVAASEDAPRNWGTGVAEGLRLLGLLAFPLIVLFVLYPIGVQPVMARPTFAVGFWLTVVECTLTTCLLLRRSRSLRTAALLAATTLVATALMVPWRVEIHPIDLWAPGMAAVPLLSWTLMLLPRGQYRRCLLPPAVAVLVVQLIGPLFFWQLTPLRLVDELFVWEPLVTLVIFAHGLRGIAERHDAAAAQASKAWNSSLAQRAENRARREAARLLHDHVLHALHAISQERSLVSRCEAVLECGNTLAELEHPSLAAGTVQLADLLEQDIVLQRVAGRAVGDAEPVPAAVAQGIAAATHEALVNVERHARADECTVQLESFGTDGCRVTITDDGRGFDPSRRPRGRLGLQHSVVERMEDIGGLAVISSKPAAGTSVVLTWPQPANAEGREVLGGGADGQTRAILARAALPGMVTTLLMMVLLAHLVNHPALAVGTTLAALALAGWTAWRVPRHAITPLNLAFVVLAALLAWVTNLVAVPAGASVYTLWMAWGATAMLQLPLLGLSRRGGAVLGGCLLLAQALGVCLRFGPSAAWDTYSGAVVAGAIVVLVGYRAFYQAQDIAAQVDDQDARRAAIRRDVVRMHQLARLDQFWSDRVARDALPLVAGVARGELDPNDEQVRHEARRMESLVRDELLLGPGPQVLTERLGRLRGLGWQVQSSLSRDDSSSLLATAVRLVELVGGPGHPGQTITLSASADAVTAVVLDATHEQRRQWDREVPRLGGTMDHDPDFVRLGLVAS